MNLSKKKLRFYLVLFVLLVFAIYYHFFLDPILEATQLSLRGITIFQDSMETAANKRTEVNSIKNAKEQFLKSLSEKQAKLPEQLDSYDLIHMLSKVHANRLIRHSLIFLESTSSEDFCVIPVRFSFSTDNKGLLNFLSGLKELPNQPTISYMQISANEIKENNQVRVDENTKIRYNLDVEMTLNFYARGNEE